MKVLASKLFLSCPCTTPWIWVKGKTPSLSLEVLDWLLPNYENKNPLNQSNILLGITRRKGKDSRVRRRLGGKGYERAISQNRYQAGKMAQWKTCFLCKPRTWVCIPRNHVNARLAWSPAYSSSLEKSGQDSPRESWLAKLTKLGSSGFDWLLPASVGQVERVIRYGSWHQPQAPTWIHTCACMPTPMHKYAYTQACHIYTEREMGESRK